MAHFEFFPNTFSVEIGDLTFDIRADNEFSEKLSRLSAECETEIRKTEGRDPCRFLAHVIDELLGKGTAMQIFGTDVPNLYDASDVIAYLCDEYQAYNRRRSMRCLAALSDGDREDCK